MVQKEKENINYYKISTFVLVGIIIVIGSIYILNWFGSSRFNEGYIYGQQSVFNGIITNLDKDGYVSFGERNTSITLVSVTLLQKQKEQTILEIIDAIKTQGYVELYDNETKFILVPYKN